VGQLQALFTRAGVPPAQQQLPQATLTIADATRLFNAALRAQPSLAGIGPRMVAARLMQDVVMSGADASVSTVAQRLWRRRREPDTKHPVDRTRLRREDPAHDHASPHALITDSPEFAMMTTQNIAAELMYRINGDIEHFGGVLPKKTAIAWRGYLAAMLEWNVITVEQYDSLLVRIPPVSDDPAIAILRGRD
jgi:hypothetical protein